jgi:NADPH:quinone reductase-like Zn-dependent oxidoreductase
VGGDAAARLLDLLSESGSLVAYTSATGQPMSIRSLALIGKRASVHGFFVGQYDYATKVLPVIREAAPLVASRALFVPPAAVYDLDDIQEAMEHVVRGGKILLKVARS